MARSDRPSISDRFKGMMKAIGNGEKSPLAVARYAKEAQDARLRLQPNKVRSPRRSRHEMNIGDRWQEGDLIFTVNPTDDPKVGDSQGFYLSIKDVKTGEHSTAVYRRDGSFAPVKANRDWRDTP